MYAIKESGDVRIKLFMSIESIESGEDDIARFLFSRADCMGLEKFECCMNGSRLIDLSDVAVEGGILALSLLDREAKYWAGVAGVVTLLPPGR